jgi:hypothetical protein
MNEDEKDPKDMTTDELLASLDAAEEDMEAIELDRMIAQNPAPMEDA